MKMLLSKNSALFWLPSLLETDELPVPRTEVIKFMPEDLFPILEDAPPGLSFSIEDVRDAVNRIGTPCFLRTDLASAKHCGPSAYRINSSANDDLWRTVFQTFEDNCTKFMQEMPQAFLVREWLTLPAPFTAFDGHPVAREWRLFVENTGVTACFYWPRASIERRLDAPPTDWETQYRHLARVLEHAEFQELEAYARRSVDLIGGDEWSVDFAQDANGKWWLIDMALAAHSWRPA